MIIAIPYADDGTIFQHTGKTEIFKFYVVEEDNTIKDSYLLPTNGRQHGLIGDVLKEENTDVLLCCHMGGGLFNVLTAKGISVYSAPEGDCDETVNLFLMNKLTKTTEAGECGCHHEEGHEEHSCGCHHE
ncbi:MAG: NifB/NifX family molybdenum-iron cluster-binding protein [Bacilli bacterium]